MGREYFPIFGDSHKSRGILFIFSISARFHKTPPPQKKHADVESQKEKKYTMNFSLITQT